MSVAQELARRCLFVIGPAKSGTTVLMEALNDSRAIYLLDEPDLHRQDMIEGFAARFNAHYARWACQPTKGRFCPDFFDGGGTWLESLARLADSHGLVGTKIVTRPFPSSEQIGTILGFHTRHFYDSHYVFSFRAPAAIVPSSYYFQRAFGDPSAPVADVIRNFVDTVGLFITMRRTFPKVSAVFHEDMGDATFEKLGRELGMALTRAPTYYASRSIKDHPPLALSAEEIAAIEAAAGIYDELAVLVREDMPQLQLGQTFLGSGPIRATGPGKLAERCHQLGRMLAGPAT